VLLREPDRFILKPALDARAAILSLIEDEVGIGLWFLLHGFDFVRFELFDKAE
jgi:hypothetical protein